MTNDEVFNKVLCVALVATLMLPLGQTLFPHVQHVISAMPFDALEAVVSATLGFGLHAALFG